MNAPGIRGPGIISATIGAEEHRNSLAFLIDYARQNVSDQQIVKEKDT